MNIKIAITGMIMAAAVFAEQTSTFEVKEIDSAKVTELAALESKLEAAMVDLKAAEERAAKAKKNRDEAETALKQEFREYDSGCQATGIGNDMGHNFPMNYVRSSRKVEIRGKYALITSDKESCGGYGLTNNLVTRGSSSITVDSVGNGRSISASPLSK